MGYPGQGGGVGATAGRPAVRLQASGLVSVLDADPDLAAGLSREALATASPRLRAEVRSLARGQWRPADEPVPARPDFGMLVLEGAIVRHVTVGDRRSAELLGAGDILRPAQPDRDEYALVVHTAAWTVVAPLRVAVLDHDLVVAAAAYDGIIDALAGRLIERSRSLALRHAISQIPNLERRLQLLLWHLADRWGRRQRDGVVIPLRLSQELLGDLAAARRSSVNAALGQLSERGLVERVAGGHLVLRGDPPAPQSVRTPTL